MSKKIKVPRFKAELGYQTTPERSALMSKIKSKETKPEISLRKELWKEGIRYRINVKELPSCPDIVIRKHKLVIFVDGEFWHGYEWEIKKKKIKANRDFWIPKIERNMQRDKQNNLELERMGYTVLRFWEHQIKKELTNCIMQIKNIVNQGV
ncbi:MAG: very short patch repair endonuclease [Flavipsychrobacter sp.]|jgi:DNA mismatch endonuclease (patch repair protein)|nr:very short patch repair endonuclease [Flavipsychrobacter sp.]